MPKANSIKTCPGCTDADVRKHLPFEQQCSACRKKERNRVWREQNPGAMAANAKRWRDAGNKSVRPEGYAEKHRLREQDRYKNDPVARERIKATSRKRRIEKPDEVKAANKAWQKAHAVEQRRYRRDYARARRATDPEYRQRCLDAQTMWRVRNWARDPQSNSWIHHQENQAIDPAWRSKLHIWQEDRCYLCNKIDGNLTIEHLVPRSRGGPTIKQNIVYSCSSCNYSRQNRIWWQEWTPREVEPTADKILLRYTTISTELDRLGLDGSPRSDGGFTLQTDKREARPLYIVSTFAGSERNPGSSNGRTAARLKMKHPDAIVLFDHEWYGRREAVLNMLRSKMGIAVRQVGARDASVVEVTADVAKTFMRQNHVMGAIDTAIRIGLIDDNGDLCALGLFVDQESSFECVRLAFAGHVPGGMSRIMRSLWKLYGKKPITSFVDTRYAIGDGHETIGFKNIGTSAETYLWVFPDRVQHQRYLSNDNKMSRNLLYFNPDAPAEDNIKANGVFRIWLPKKIRMVLEP